MAKRWAGKLAQGREKPKKRGRKLLIAVAVGAGGFGLALAASEGLRSRLFGSGSPAEAGVAEGEHR